MPTRARIALVLAIVAVAAAGVAAADDGQKRPADLDAARQDFVDVSRVLLSPRCKNCHPVGDAPLHGDTGAAHAMNVSRHSPEVGLQCTACHREQNGRRPGSPPGVPNWHMPTRETPMVFEGKSSRELCLALKDPHLNGGRSLEAILEHVRNDRLVLWGWNPGPGRSLPPLSHDEFVERVRRWIVAGAPCPET